MYLHTDSYYLSNVSTQKSQDHIASWIIQTTSSQQLIVTTRKFASFIIIATLHTAMLLTKDVHSKFCKKPYIVCVMHS